MTDDGYRQLMKHAKRLAQEGHGELAQHLRDAIDLRAEVEALRADAERYRWLRAQHWHDGPMCVVVAPKQSVKLGADCPSEERLDAFIYAARAAQGERG